MTRPHLNPLTALFQAALPLTLAETLAHLERKSEDGIEVAVAIDKADWGWVPPSRQIELVEGEGPDSMGFALSRFLSRKEQVDPVVAAAVWVKHYEMAPSLTHAQRAEYLPSIDRLRMALRQILMSFLPGASRSEDSFLLGGVERVEARTLALVAAEIRDEVLAWDAIWPRTFPEEENRGQDLLRSCDFADPMADDPRMPDLLALADLLTPAKDPDELARALNPIRRLWADLSPTRKTSEDTLTIAKAAKLAGCSGMTVTRWLQQNPGLGHKVGGRWEVDAAAFRAFLDRPAAA